MRRINVECLLNEYTLNMLDELELKTGRDVNEVVDDAVRAYYEYVLHGGDLDFLD